jgi:hypothetical protein
MIKSEPPGGKNHRKTNFFSLQSTNPASEKCKSEILKVQNSAAAEILETAKLRHD